jgi:ABC-2 type transport system ATP-binding protein
MISVRELKKTFGNITAVDGISFEIAKGEVFGLLGPNGAGKTTTIMMLVGALRPDSGSVAIDGEPDPTRPSVRRRIGTTPQALAIYEELTAEENIRFFGKLFGLSGSRLKERTEFVLDLVGLTDRRKSKAAEYSGGMKRRLNMACSMVHDPSILLFDEPTVGVDPQSRNLIFDKIEELKVDSRTIIYTTHYMEEAQRLCNRVAIVDHGRILDIGTVDDLIERHGGKSVITGILVEPPSRETNLPGTLTDQTQWRLESDHPIEDVARLTNDGLKFTSLKIDRPDLESVFLNLTGRRLRD